eukprot:2942171-Prymnesium_polylepis.7
MRFRVSRGGVLRDTIMSTPAGLVILTVLASFASCSQDCCLTASISEDPHVVGAHRDKFSFRGTNNGIYNLLTAPGVSVNAQFELVNFRATHSKLTMHASFVRSVFWVLLQPSGEELHITFAGRSPYEAVVTGRHGKLVVRTSTPFAAEGLSISLHRKMLVVQTPKWRTVAVATVYHPHLWVLRVNVRVTSLYRVCAQPIAPHGILGQTFDCECVAPPERETLRIALGLLTLLLHPSCAQRRRAAWSGRFNGSPRRRACDIVSPWRGGDGDNKGTRRGGVGRQCT